MKVVIFENHGLVIIGAIKKHGIIIAINSSLHR